MAYHNNGPYTVTNQGMKKGSWKIVDKNGNSVRSGINSKAAAQSIAAQLSTKGEWNNTY